MRDFSLEEGMRKIIFIKLFILVSLFFVDTALAVNPSKIPLFQSEEILQVEMQIPFEEVKNGQEDELKPDLLSYEYDQQTYTIHVDFSARRLSQKNLLRISSVQNQFEKRRKKLRCLRALTPDLKFVTQCTFKEKTTAKKKFFKNTLFIKCIEASGLPSFKVRLARVVYKNPQGAFLTEGYGFFIENRKRLYETHKHRGDHSTGNGAAARFRCNVRSSSKKSRLEGIDETTVKGQNVYTLFNKQNQVVQFVPYDFDLTAYTAGSDFSVYWNDKK